MSQTIGDHVIPAWSAVSKTSVELVDKVKDKAGVNQSTEELSLEDNTTISQDEKMLDKATNRPNTRKPR